jgi:hypothetical protein
MQATPYDGDRGAAFRVRLLPSRLRLPIEGVAWATSFDRQGQRRGHGQSQVRVPPINFRLMAWGRSV